MGKRGATEAVRRQGSHDRYINTTFNRMQHKRCPGKAAKREKKAKSNTPQARASPKCNSSTRPGTRAGESGQTGKQQPRQREGNTPTRRAEGRLVNHGRRSGRAGGTGPNEGVGQLSRAYGKKRRNVGPETGSGKQPPMQQHAAMQVHSAHALCMGRRTAREGCQQGSREAAKRGGRARPPPLAHQPPGSVSPPTSATTRLRHARQPLHTSAPPRKGRKSRGKGRRGERGTH